MQALTVNVQSNLIQFAFSCKLACFKSGVQAGIKTKNQFRSCLACIQVSPVISHEAKEIEGVSHSG